MVTAPPDTRATDVVERGLAIFLVVWGMAFLGVHPQLRPSAAAGPLISSAVLVAGGLVLVGLVATFGPRSWARLVVPTAWAATVLLSVAALAALVTVDHDLTTAWPTGVSYLTVAVGTAGLRLRARTATAVIVVQVIIMVVAMEAIQRLGGEPLDSVLYGSYVLMLGAICVVFATVLRRTAAATDAARLLLSRAVSARDAGRTVQRDIAAAERALHDTVLNTLGAVGGGDLRGREDDVRQWCARAADEVRSLTRPGGTGAGTTAVDASLHAAARELAPALSAPIDGADLSLERLPAPVAAALVTATAEALRNADRHSGAGSVRVDGSTARDGSVTVSVSDDGIGFDPAERPARLGMTRSVHGAMSQVGGTATVTSRSEGGTVVTLSWTSAPSPVATRQLADEVTRATSRVAPAVLVPSALLALASLVYARDEYERPGLALAAFGLMLAVYALAIVTGLRGRIGWPVALVVFAGTAAVFSLENAGHDGAPGLWSSWSSEAMLCALVVVVVAGPRWAWIPALVTWWATLGFDPVEFVRPGGALLLSAAVAAVALQAGARSYERSIAETMRLETEAVAGAEAERRRRERWGMLRTTTLPLLSGLAEGSLDPADRRVQARCRDEERFVRALVRLDPGAGPLPAMLLDLATTARQRDVPLDIDLRDDVDQAVPLSPADVARVGAGLRAVIESLPADPGGPAARLTGGAEGADVVLRLVTAPPASPGAPVAGLDLTCDEEAGLWEAVLVPSTGVVR